MSTAEIDNLASGGATAGSGQILPEHQTTASSIDEMLVNTSTQSPLLKADESPRWMSGVGGHTDGGTTTKSRRSVMMHTRRPSQISVPEIPSGAGAMTDEIGAYQHHHVQSPRGDLQDDQDLQDLTGGGAGASSGDADDRKYCICRDISFGEMIACDAPNCPIEWFHYPCVNLSVAPKGKWICPLCSTGSSSAVRKRNRR